MLALVEFEDCVTALEVMAGNQTGCLELSQYPVHRSQTYIVAAVQ